MMIGTLMQAVADTDSGSAGIVGVSIGVGLVFLVLGLIGYWKVFEKIGLPGWMGIVPFVNVYMVFKARGEHEPVLWLILSLIPCISIVAYWMASSDTAEMFGKGVGWKLFLFFIPGLSHIALGFGSATVDPSKVAPGMGINAAAV